MTIGIVGLGLMGASFAMKLSEKNIRVLGFDIHKETIQLAKTKKIIQEGSTRPEEWIHECDLVLFALYPTKILPWILQYQQHLKSHCLLMDISGVKSNILEPIQDQLREDLSLLSIHPMCGRESRGIKFADPTIFSNANFIIIPTKMNTEEEIQKAKKLAHFMDFGKISCLNIEEHDRMIGFLSQLTHCIAISLMNTHDNTHLADYTGDSFRDLTRIASINEDLWSELFLLNKDILLDEMNQFIDTISHLRDTLAKEDKEELRRLMIQSTKRRKIFNKE